MFIQAPLCKNEKLGKKFCSLLFSMLLLLTTVVAVTIQSPAMAEATTTVQPGKYLDHVVENSQATLQEKDIPGDAVHISSSSMPTTWVDGKTYVVAAGEGGTVTVAGTRITVNGTVNLILTNRTTLHIPKGIGLADNAVLNIFAQSDDPDDAGKLVIDGVDSGNAGIGTSANWNPGAGVGITVNIHGGVINAAGGRERYGVFGAGAGAGVGSGAGAAGAVNVGVFGGVLNAAGGKLDNGFSGAGVGSGAGAGGAVNVGVFGGALNAAGGQGYHSGAGIGSGTAASHATTVFKDGVIFINGWDPSWQNGDSSDGNATNKATVFVGSFDGEQVFELHDDSSLNKDAVLPATIKRLTGFNGVTPVWVTTSPTYKIPAGKTLTVPEGKHLDVQGKLQNAGTIVNQGEIFAPNYTEENGTVQKRNTIGAASVTRAGDTLTFNSGSWAGTSEKGDGVQYCFRQYGASSWDCVNNPIRRLPSVGGFYQTKMQYASDLQFYVNPGDIPVQSFIGESYLSKTYNETTHTVETTSATMETYQSISAETTTWSGTEAGGVGTFYMPVPAEGSSVVEIPDSRVSVSGKVNLVLPDGVTLHIPKGIELENEAVLNILAQSDDPDVAGKLVIDGVDSGNAGIGTSAEWNRGDSVAMTVNIHGGVISAAGGNLDDGYSGAGVGSGAGADGAVNVGVFGGVLNAAGGNLDDGFSGAGVGSGAGADGAVNVGVFGGVLNAAGGNAVSYSGAGVGRGADARGDVRVQVFGGVINAAGGQGSFSGAGVGSGALDRSRVTVRVFGGVLNAAGGNAGRYSGAGAGTGGGAGVGSGAMARGDVRVQVFGGVINAAVGQGSYSGAGVGSGAEAAGTVTTTFKNGVVFINYWDDNWQNGDISEEYGANKATVFVGSFNEGQVSELHDSSNLTSDLALPASIKLLTGMNNDGVPRWSTTTPTYKIPEGKTLTVPDGKTLDVNGSKLAIAGVLDVVGTLAGTSGQVTNTGDVVIRGINSYSGAVTPRQISPVVSAVQAEDNKAKVVPPAGLSSDHAYEYQQVSNDWVSDSVFDHNIGVLKSYQIRVAGRDKASGFFTSGAAVPYTVGVNEPNVLFDPSTEKLTGFVSGSTYEYRIVEAGHENSGPEPGWENLSFDPGSGIAALPSDVLERIKTGVVQLELKRIVNGQASVAHSVVVSQRLAAPVVSVDGVNRQFVISTGATYKKLSADSDTPASCTALTDGIFTDVETWVDAVAGDKLVACIKATDSAPASIVTVVSAEAQPVPVLSIDYAGETFSAKDSSNKAYAAADLEYLNASSWQTVSGFSLGDIGWTGSAKDVQLRVKGTAVSGAVSGKLPSAANTLSIPARPDAPSVTEAFADGGYMLPADTKYVVKDTEDASLAAAVCSADVATQTVTDANDVITVNAGQHLYACALGNNTLKVFASRYSSVSPSQFPAVTVTPDYANESFTVTGGENASWSDLQYRTSGADTWQDVPATNSFASFGLSDTRGLSLFFRRKGSSKLASDSTNEVKVAARSTPTNSLSLVNENVVVARGQKYLVVAAGSSNSDVPETCKDASSWTTAAADADTTVSLQPGDKLLVCDPATNTAVASKVATITAPQRQAQPVATPKYAEDGFTLPVGTRYATTTPEESLCSALTNESDDSSVIKAYELWACTPAGENQYASEIEHVVGAQQVQPNPEINYAAEKLTGVAGVQWVVSAGSTSWNDLDGSEVALADLNWNGSAATVWVRTRYSDSAGNKMFSSDPVEVSLKARSATPQIDGSSVTNASFADTADGKFTLPAGDMSAAGTAHPTFTVECATANGCGGFVKRTGVAAGTEVSGLPVGSYQVIQEATNSSFASGAGTVDINPEADRIWKVEPRGEIDFGDSDYGDAVQGQNIVVNNQGNSAIQVTGVAVSGADAGAFELSEVSPLPEVAAGKTGVPVATVTPVATADAQDNVYQATITITYNELPVAANAGGANKTVTVNVKRKVNKAAQNNPGQLAGPTVVTDVAAEFTALQYGLGAAALYQQIAGTNTAVPAAGGAGWVAAPKFAELTANTNYEVWAYYPAVTNYQQTNPVKVGSFKTLRAAPAVTVDADTEAFVGADTSMEYRQPETDKWTAVPENMTLASLDSSVWDGSAGVAIEFRYKADAGLAAGVAQTVQVSSRQPQPAVTVVQQPSFADTADGQIKLPGGSGDRFTVDGTGDYPGGSLVPGLGVGDHTVAQKAGGGFYKSQPQVVTLTAQGTRNWQVDADEPAIADLTFGVEPQDLNVELRNVGNSPVRITGVASSNEQVVSAQLADGTVQQILAPGASVADAIVISPAAGLDANSYAGEVTVSWQPVVGEAAAPGQQAQETKIAVSFTVVKAAQAAPAAAQVEVAQVTATTVQLRLVQSEQAQLEYALVPAGSSPDRWQQGLEFSGLTPATKYEVFVRVAGDNNHQASPAVSSGLVTTAAAAVSDEEVLAPDVVDYGSGEIKDAGLEFATSKDFAPDTILPAGTDLKDLAGQTVFVRVKADPETGAGASAPVEIKIPKVQDAPQLEVVDGQLVAPTGTGVETGRLEYRAAGATGAEGAWQPLPADGKLPAGYFEVRFAGSPTAGFASQPVTVAVATTIDQVQVQQVGDTSIRVTPVAADPITGAPAEYSVDGGHAWQTDPVFTGLEPEHKYTVAVRYQGQKMTPVTVEAQTTVAAPKQVDFFAPASEVEFATREDFAADAVLPAGADLSLYAGQTIYVRAKENPGSGAAASPVVAVKVPQRAMTPQLQVTPWGISGLDPNTAYEYQAQGEQDWTAIALGTTELTLAPGTYLVRAAANSGAGLFASLPQTVVITRAAEDDEVVKADSPLQVVKSMSFGFLAVIAGMLAVIVLPSFLFYVFATGQLPAESSGLPIAGLGRK